MKRLRRHIQRSMTIWICADGLAVTVSMKVLGFEVSTTMAPDDARLLAAGLHRVAAEADHNAAEAIR